MDRSSLPVLHSTRGSAARGVLIALVSIAILGATGLWLARSWYLNRPVTPPATGATVPGAGDAGEGGPGAGLPEDGIRPPDGAALFGIAPGDGFGAVARRLEREGWVDWAFPLRFEARLREWDRQITPGYYRYREGETILQLLERMVAGEIEEAQVTLPEGWRLDRMLETLADSTWVPVDAYRELADSAAWWGARGVPGPSLEGYLLPETYRVPRGESPERVLFRLIEAGTRFWEDSLQTRAESLGLDRAETWALASVVEAESAVPEERRRIAAVFWNRLERGMKLESDPTVLFALGRPPGRVLYRDLEVDSPYNTYRYPGIPPGPICAPGKASLRAAVDPLDDCDDLFFVARGDGTHVFSKTLAAHNQARRRIRRAASAP